jgi:hypothetical protein
LRPQVIFSPVVAALAAGLGRLDALAVDDAGRRQRSLPLLRPGLTRFAQPDSLVPDWANPQDLNRYSYGRNNPLRYTDPTGRTAYDPADYDCTPG